MYSHQLRGFGDSVDCTDPNNYDDPSCIGVDVIPGFTPAVGPSTSPAPSSSGGINLTSLLTTALNDVTQIIRPGAYSTSPLYSPSSTALSNSVRSLAPLLLLGGLAYVALGKRR